MELIKMMKFKGIIPALATPLKDDETINVPVLKNLIEFLMSQDADGFYVGGATGEGLALKTEERMVLAEESVKATEGKKPCIVQIAAMNFEDTIRLAKHAESVGAAAISATAPLFFAYDKDDVFNYYKKIADSVSIPMMMYYNPAAGFKFDAQFAARLFKIDNVTAIKWTSSDYYGVMRLKDLTHGEMNIINGPDEMLLMGLNAGADGGIGTTYNFMLPTIKKIYNNFIDGNIKEAQKEQNLADRIIEVLIGKYKGIPATKVILEEMGFSVGNACFPMKRYSKEQKAEIIADMKAAGLKI